MFTYVLISFVVVPVFLGMATARARRAREAALLLFGLFGVYCVVYMIVLQYLRHRWVG